MKITVDNFFINSEGTFKEIDKVPEDFEIIFESTKSKYFTNKGKTKLVRISNHWGYNIKKCNWFIDTYPKIEVRKWSKIVDKSFKICIIDFSNLKLVG